MTTLKLKTRLIKRIQETKNSDLLNEVFRLLELEKEDIEIYKLNDEQKKSIDKARKEIAQGDFLSTKKQIKK